MESMFVFSVKKLLVLEWLGWIIRVGKDTQFSTKTFHWSFLIVWMYNSPMWHGCSVNCLKMNDLCCLTSLLCHKMADYLRNSQILHYTWKCEWNTADTKLNRADQNLKHINNTFCQLRGPRKITLAKRKRLKPPTFYRKHFLSMHTKKISV